MLLIMRLKGNTWKCVQIGSSSFSSSSSSSSSSSVLLLLLLVQFPWKLIPKHDSAHRKILRNKHSHANSIFSLSFSWHYLLLSLLLLMMMLVLLPLMPLLLCSSVYLVFEFIRSLFAPEFPILLLFHLKAMNMSCLLSKRESGKAPQ